MKPLFESATLAKSPVTDVTPIFASAPALAKTVLLPAVIGPADPPLQAMQTVKPPSITEDQIAEIGASAAGELQGVSTKLLTHVRASDAGDFGKGLGSLVVLAKGLNPDNLKATGVVGRVKGLFSTTKERLMSQFASAEKQIDALTHELDTKVVLHKQRITDLEGLYTDNYAYHERLTAAVQRCQTLVADTQAEYEAERRKETPDSFGAQTLADYPRLIARLEKRIDDLERAKILSKQVAPQIRIMQDDTRSLVQKFGDVKAVALPAWRNSFALYVLQLEQKKSVQLLKSIDDATEDALRKSADLLRGNSVAIAESRNRSVVSIETLTHIQTQLVGALEDVKRIDTDGRNRRTAETSKLLAMEQELIKSFAPGQR